MDWVIGNYVEIFAALGAVVTAATAVAAITPNKKDDEIVGMARKVLDFFRLRIG